MASRSSMAASRPVRIDARSNRSTCLNNRPRNATSIRLALSTRISCRFFSATSISASSALALRYRSIAGVLTGATIIASWLASAGGFVSTSRTARSAGSTRRRHGPSVISQVMIRSAGNRYWDAPGLAAFSGSNLGIPAGIHRWRTAGSVTPKNSATSAGEPRMNNLRLAAVNGIASLRAPGNRAVYFADLYRGVVHLLDQVIDGGL